MTLRPNKKCVSGDGSENLRWGSYPFLWKKNIILYILKGISPFKMHKTTIFSTKTEKILGFTSKFRKGRVT